MRPYTTTVFVFAFLVAWGIDDPAYAYLDPGTGSMILQGLLAAGVGAMVAGRLYWQRIKSYFSRKRTSEDGEEKSE
jgi:hypothetical protein